MSCVINILLGITAEEIIQDTSKENITEFGTLEYYVFLYLDLYYIGYKAKVNIKEGVVDFYEWIQTFAKGKNNEVAVREK